jgi:hypothetical protein
VKNDQLRREELRQQELRPRPADARWTWRKIAILAAFLLAALLLLLFDLDR